MSDGSLIFGNDIGWCVGRCRKYILFVVELFVSSFDVVIFSSVLMVVVLCFCVRYLYKLVVVKFDK